LGIAVSNTPGYGANAVAEHALGLMLALARDTVAMDRAMREGRWPREEVRGFELAGKTLGVVGLGQIGTTLAQMCAGLSMRVLGWNRTVTPERLAVARAEYADLPDLMARSDIVSLHLAQAPETERLISRELLARMKTTAYLVNTARGELIDDDALLDALRAGRIAGAALDVFSAEPLPADHPYRGLPNVILTPHVGFRTPEASGRSVRIAIENLIGQFTGRAQNVVNG
jgi:D-3-phosphoglycerate dehydrogenase